MEIDHFRNLADEMHNALDLKNPTQISPSMGTLNAIDYCLSYLFACVLYLGNHQLEYINGNQYKEFSSSQRKKFDSLFEELRKKNSALEASVSAQIKQIYTDIDEEEILFDDIEEHKAVTRDEIQFETRTYLTKAGLDEKLINETAKTVFDYLSLIKNSSQRSQIKKLELRHNFGGALSFVKYFF